VELKVSRVFLQALRVMAIASIATGAASTFAAAAIVDGLADKTAG
jgi:hypothetical protein